MKGAGVVGLTWLLGAAAASGQEPESRALPPRGFGSLHQADVSIMLRGSDLQVSILPLDERIIRLLATDSYNSLHNILTDRREEIDQSVPGRGSDATSVFLVTMHANRTVAFDPHQLTVMNRNRYFRPVAILPVSPRWSEHRLNQNETLSALFVFDGGLDPLLPMIVEYGETRVSTWGTTLRRLEVERARVEARARGTVSETSPLQRRHHGSTSPA